MAGVLVYTFRWLPGLQAVWSYRREWLPGGHCRGSCAHDAAGPAEHDV